MKRFFQEYGLFLAWLIALITMLATLAMDQVLRWPVCLLCWYQRVAIYPLVILLGIAVYRDDRHIIPYALPFCVIGFLLALYQYLEQMVPGFAPISVCTESLPCNIVHVAWLGFITLPFLSMLVCLVLFGLMMVVYQNHRKRH